MNGSDFGLRKAIFDQLTSDLETDFEKRIRVAGPVPIPQQIISVFMEFSEQKIAGALNDNNLMRAIWALGELRVVLSELLSAGRMELIPIIKMADAGIARIRAAVRTRLVRGYLDPTTSPDELQELRDGLIDLIRSGAWPNWQQDFNAAVEGCDVGQA
jgi:hypothetical protein